MKFQPDTLDGVNAVTRCTASDMMVNATRWTHSVLVPWRGTVQAWDGARVGMLLPEHFERLVALRPEVVIFGSGPTLKFPPASLIRALIDARIGLETMDTPAACRTYNVLAAEGRHALAALLQG
jgi:uncharacterized protein